MLALESAPLTVAEIADRVMKQPGGGKALLFEHVDLREVAPRIARWLAPGGSLVAVTQGPGEPLAAPSPRASATSAAAGCVASMVSWRSLSMLCTVASWRMTLAWNSLLTMRRSMSVGTGALVVLVAIARSSVSNCCIGALDATTRPAPSMRRVRSPAVTTPRTVSPGPTTTTARQPRKS